jgi:hypothetical protein
MNQVRMGLPVAHNTTLWVGRQMNGASALHISAHPDNLDGMGLDNQPFCIFSKGCFTTNLAQKSVNPYANRLLVEYNPENLLAISASYTPHTLRDSIYQESQDTRKRNHHELSLGMQKHWNLSSQTAVNGSLGYTYDKEGEHLIQTTLSGKFDDFEALGSYGIKEGLTKEERFSVSVVTPLQDDMVYMTWSKRLNNTRSPSDWQLGYKIPLDDDKSMELSFAFQCRTYENNFQSIDEAGAMIAWGVIFE